MKQPTKAIICAAGLGTRFLPQTKAMPKEMLPLVDKPIIQQIVEELCAAGITDIVIVTGYHKRTIEDHFDHYPALKEQSRLLQTIPGSGEKTADLLLAEIEFGRYQSAGEVAAYAGVTPKRKESGTSLHRTNLSKMGNKRVRKGLYFPAIVAAKHNRIVKEFAARLEGSGKTSMQVVCASIRKLLHIAFGVLKHKTPFDASLVFSS